jgi:hypothetical protein|tara:strand:- start:309 stop:467 length:159 start_codon:yes stop_codon:yes gene_type:complete
MLKSDVNKHQQPNAQQTDPVNANITGSTQAQNNNNLMAQQEIKMTKSETDLN